MGISIERIQAFSRTETDLSFGCRAVRALNYQIGGIMFVATSPSLMNIECYVMLVTSHNSAKIFD